jgi:hypothetical protein
MSISSWLSLEKKSAISASMSSSGADVSADSERRERNPSESNLPELEEAKARAKVLQAQAIAEQKAYRAKCLRNTALFATAATVVVGTPVVYFSFFNQKVATTPSQRIETDNHFSSGGIDVIPAVGAQKTPLETKPNENDPADAASKLGRKFRDSLQGDKK